MPPNAQEPNESATTRERLIHKFSTDGDLLSLGLAIARVVALASSDDEAPQTLTYYVLADVALTQKILRLANTVFYRSVARTPITTISRAIFLLGFDTVKTTALALLLVDNLANRKHAAAIRAELVESLCASLMGRELARQSNMQGGEEAAIAALFKNLGRCLMASHEHGLYRQIADETADGVNPGQAAVRVMGCSYAFLTDTVLRAWNFPESLIQALEPSPAGGMHVPKNRLDWMRQVVSFSADAAKLVMAHGDALTQDQAQVLIGRYGTALHLDMERLRQLFAVVGRDIGQVIKALDLHRPLPSGEAAVAAEKPVNRLPGILRLSTLDIHMVQTEERYPSGKPLNARDRLLEGIQTATQMMGAGNYKPSELIFLVLETLYSSMGFRFATLCIKDPRHSNYRAVLSIGEQHAARQPRFVFPLGTGDDMFYLAMENCADLMIADTQTAKVQDLLPAWHKQLLPDARSIMLLPLVQGKNVLGVLYADRREPAEEGINSDEAALIKTLMGQMMTAISVR